MSVNHVMFSLAAAAVVAASPVTPRGAKGTWASPGATMDKRNFDLCSPSLNCGFSGSQLFYNKAYYTSSENQVTCADKCRVDPWCEMYSVATGVCHHYVIGALFGALRWSPGVEHFYDDCCTLPVAPTTTTTTTKLATTTTQAVVTTPTTIIVTTTKAATTTTPAVTTTTTTTSKTTTTTTTTAPVATTTSKTATPSTTITTTTTTSPVAPTTTTTTTISPVAPTTTTTTTSAAPTTTQATSVSPSTTAATTTTVSATPSATPAQICGVSGWDKSSPPSSFVDGTGAYNTFASCKAVCLSKGSASFGFGGSYCLCYPAVMGNNLLLDPTSPYAFWDMTCDASTAPPAVTTTAATTSAAASTATA